jgi:hypothetical protein
MNILLLTGYQRLHPRLLCPGDQNLIGAYVMLQKVKER